MEERDFICETDFSSSCIDSDAISDLFRLATAQSHRMSHLTAVRQLSFSTSSCQSPGSCNTPHILPQRGSDGPLSSATSSASREMSHSSFVLRSAALETSSDILAQILREVQKTSKEVDQVKACVSDLDKQMAAVEQKRRVEGTVIVAVAQKGHQLAVYLTKSGLVNQHHIHNNTGLSFLVIILSPSTSTCTDSNYIHRQINHYWAMTCLLWFMTWLSCISAHLQLHKQLHAWKDLYNLYASVLISIVLASNLLVGLVEYLRHLSERLDSFWRLRWIELKADYVVEASVHNNFLLCKIREDVSNLYKWQTFWHTSLYLCQIHGGYIDIIGS